MESFALLGKAKCEGIGGDQLPGYEDCISRKVVYIKPIESKMCITYILTWEKQL